ncbi:FKBP-type peptidyl-prolyl cis-trans isomerase [Mycetocola zhadangensis]|uniref:FKBP-type peptidyl-prolyl cis-trans isomerase n=1 Tax=Mycetocola zhadangensis TaxID=1164595 RepID=UPI001602FE87|nr:FKBP-type peptidyl-prolyl cis-trans isomerase [Mycetocola zhadangensis]GGE89575.1 peptidylprolyl isomerase [Mycetocola zhadangensis]
MQKAPALLLTAGVVLTALTGCAQAPGSDCEAPVTSGDASNVVEATGKLGTTPAVDFPTPLKTVSTQVSTLIEGDGAPIAADQLVEMSFSFYNGTTGEPVEEGAYTEPGVYLPSQLLPGMAASIECATVGSRIAATMSPADAFGEAGSAQLRVAPDDSIVMVADITDSFLAKANGARTPVFQSGFPSVVTAADGTPGITVPKSEAPTELKVATLKTGDGAKVSANDRVVVHYTGALWEDNSIFDSSWTKGTPAVFSLDGIVPGLASAIDGKTVGSQIIAVIPPELGYGDQSAGSIPPGSTLVFVVDILGTVD